MTRGVVALLIAAVMFSSITSTLITKAVMSNSDDTIVIDRNKLKIACQIGVDEGISKQRKKKMVDEIVDRNPIVALMLVTDPFGNSFEDFIMTRHGRGFVRVKGACQDAVLTHYRRWGDE